MIYIAVLYCWFASIFVARRTGFLSPASISTTFNTLTITQFVYNIGNFNQTHIDALRQAAEPDRAPVTCLLYSGIVSIGVIIAISLRKYSRFNPREKWRFPRFEWTFLRKITSPATVRTVAVFVTILAVSEFIQIVIKGGKLAAQDQDTLTKTFTFAGGSIEFLLVAMVAYLGVNRKWNLVAILAPAILLLAFNEMAHYSRLLAITLFLASVIVSTTPTTIPRWRIYLAAAGLVLLGIWAYAYALSGRVDRQLAGVNAEAMYSHFLDPDLSIDALGDIAYNALAGANSFAATDDGRTKIYPVNYSILSFSLLPAAIDGFDVKAGEIRIHDYIPYSSFAEAVWFGPGYTLAFAVFYGLILYLMTKAYMIWSKVFTLLLGAPALLSIASMQMYPIRATFRPFVYCGMLPYVAMVRSRKRKRTAEIAPSLVPSQRLSA